MCKGMAVVFAEGALGRGPDVAKDKPRRRLGCYSVKVGAVPGRNGGSEETWCTAQLGIGVEAYPKAICIVLTATSVLDEASVSTSFGLSCSDLMAYQT